MFDRKEANDVEVSQNVGREKIWVGRIKMVTADQWSLTINLYFQNNSYG